MNNKDEALKQAIAWADFHGEDVFAGAGWSAVKSMNEWRAKCAEVLAFPVGKEPWDTEDKGPAHIDAAPRPANVVRQPRPEQEPCGWGCFLDGVLMEDLVSDEKSVDYWCASDDPEMQGVVKRALYTHPPQRKPLPLSDDEIKCIKPICADFASFRAGIRHAEREHGIVGEDGSADSEGGEV